jgi:SagB-type dehydrogenase family enzyme
MGEARVRLPEPTHRSGEPFEVILMRRRTTREFSGVPLEPSIISQLMWAAQGTLSDEARASTHRTCPSAGGTYPLVLYAISKTGVDIYLSTEHTMKKVIPDDIRVALSLAAVTDANRRAIVAAPLTVVMSVDNDKASSISPVWEDVLRYVYLETGHAAQNLALQAGALGLALCTITSYRTHTVHEALKMPLHHRPIYLIPVGYADG